MKSAQSAHNMQDTVLFGNGINRLSANAISWDALLDGIKGTHKFNNGQLPNTMVYERIYLSRLKHDSSSKNQELAIKEYIADAMMHQSTNSIFKLLAETKIHHYLTTNYDYAFEKAIGVEPERLSTEDLYSLRRKRKYSTLNGEKYLWNIHGEIDLPKTIMLGLDHYCGSVSKINTYVKGGYKHSIDGKSKTVSPMYEKLATNEYCISSWVDLFFCSNLHILGIALDYSETDIWWILNKRARFAEQGLVSNNITFYVTDIEEEKKGLLSSFNVDVKILKISDNNYESMYRRAINMIA